MEQAPIENQVDELAQRIAAVETNLASFKMFEQRRATELRVESKAYGAEILEKVERMQDQMNERFELVNTRLDDVHSGITTILQHLRPPSGS